MRDNIITNSRLTCAKTCLRKHEIMYELGIRRERESDSMYVGTMVHEGLDRLARGYEPIDVVNLIRRFDAPSGCRTPEQFIDFEIDREVAARLAYGYSWRWSEDPLVAEIVASEQSFELPIWNPETERRSTNWVRAGKIDKIAKLGDGRLAIIEHKTSGEDIGPESDYWSRLRIDHQISHYMSAARDIGYNVECVIYDVIGKPQIRPRNPHYQMTAADKAAYTQGLYFGETFEQSELDAALVAKKETPKMYGARLLQQIYEQPDRYYQRREIPRIDSDIQEYEQELWAQQQFLSERRKAGLWFRNTSACRTPFGNCECFSLCVNGWKNNHALPDGFIRLENVHPELGETNNGSTQTSTAEGDGSTAK